MILFQRCNFVDKMLVYDTSEFIYKSFGCDFHFCRPSASILTTSFRRTFFLYFFYSCFMVLFPEEGFEDCILIASFVKIHSERGS